MQVYGVPKVCRQMNQEGIVVARCTVERLMRLQGLRGAVRGKRVRTTIADMTAPRPLERVNRQFKADRANQLWCRTSPMCRRPSHRWLARQLVDDHGLRSGCT
jgi:transposase InsO family protein